MDSESLVDHGLETPAEQLEGKLQAARQSDLAVISFLVKLSMEHKCEVRRVNRHLMSKALSLVIKEVF